MVRCTFNTVLGQTQCDFIALALMERVRIEVCRLPTSVANASPQPTRLEIRGGLRAQAPSLSEIGVSLVQRVKYFSHRPHSTSRRSFVFRHVSWSILWVNRAAIFGTHRVNGHSVVSSRFVCLARWMVFYLVEREVYISSNIDHVMVLSLVV